VAGSHRTSHPKLGVRTSIFIVAFTLHRKKTLSNMHVLFRARLLIALIVIRHGCLEPRPSFYRLPFEGYCPRTPPRRTGRAAPRKARRTSRELLELILHLARQFSLPLEQLGRFGNIFTQNNKIVLTKNPIFQVFAPATSWI